MRRPAARSGTQRFLALLAAGAAGPHDYVILLGQEPLPASELVQEIERGLPYSAFEHFAAGMPVPLPSLLALINVPLRTLSRRKREGRFPQDESDRLMRAARVFARALTLFEGDRDAAIRWLTQPQRPLGGSVPLALARTELGALEVERLIGRLEHGVFS